jgi:hypothetical protein
MDRELSGREGEDESPSTGVCRAPVKPAGDGGVYLGLSVVRSRALEQHDGVHETPPDAPG